MQEAETCLIMTDDRNLTSHTYIEAVADAIYGKLPSYLDVMNSLLGKIQAQVQQD